MVMPAHQVHDDDDDDDDNDCSQLEIMDDADLPGT